MDVKKIMEQLQAPFKPDEIEWRVGSTNKEKTKGLALAYVTNRAIQNRLDDVFGAFGWQNEFREWKGNSQICGISVYDEDKKIWITKWDGADDSQTEAIKGGLSDSMKRAAYQWGIGRYLYNLPDVWVELKLGKYLAETPKLPAWALPEGYKEDKKKPDNKPEGNKPPTDLNQGNKDYTITPAQRKRLYAIAGGKGYTKEEVAAAVKKKFNKEVDKLTKAEYDRVCKGYEDAKAKQESKPSNTSYNRSTESSNVYGMDNESQAFEQMLSYEGY